MWASVYKSYSLGGILNIQYVQIFHRVMIVTRVMAKLNNDGMAYVFFVSLIINLYMNIFSYNMTSFLIIVKMPIILAIFYDSK